MVLAGLPAKIQLAPYAGAYRIALGNTELKPET